MQNFQKNLRVAAAWLLAGTAGAQDRRVDFNFDVRPILSDRCFVCHGPDEKKRQADLRLDVRSVAIDAEAIVPGHPEKSELVARIFAADKTRMPPAKSNLSLTKDEAEILKRWIAQGAEYKQHWSYLPLPDKVDRPTVFDTTWPRTGVDHFVLARLDKEKLKPSPPAVKEIWLRRASFDLTGLPPTPDEVDNFLKDASTAAYGRAADRLLASPRFGERMALDWLDAARYADSFGYQADGDTHLWPYRDWVVRAFNANLPYDQFITWQLAGDLLPKPTTDQRLATAFCRLHRMTNEGGSVAEEWRQEYVADRVHTFGTVFLGLTTECCRCHDHKYDPLTAKDYYGLGAFFNSIDEAGTYNNSHWRPAPTLSLPTPEQEAALQKQSAEVARLERDLADVQKSKEAAFREWVSKLQAKDAPKTPVGCIGKYSFDAKSGLGKLDNEIDDRIPGSSSAANKFVAGKVGDGLAFTGDDPANFPNVGGSFERYQPFTIAFYLKLNGPSEGSIVLHRSAGTDTGFNGIELFVEEGRLRFALVRFWPGNAAAVRTAEKISTDKWVHVCITSDGSGRAAGLHISLDGKKSVNEIVRDKLTKNFEAGGNGLTFGERFRTIGLKGGALDELRIFDRALTAVEIAHLADGSTLGRAFTRKSHSELADYFFAVVDKESRTQREALAQARQALFATQTAVFDVLTMAEELKPRTTYVLKRGEYDAPKDHEVKRQVPAVLPMFPQDAPVDRLGLARWLTHPRHPLTARVAVNRHWQLFFGRGLVVTQENFGVQGALPSHPELLDWLARDFINSGWDVKQLCRTIVLSATYRQQSATTKDIRDRDPDNVLLARGPSRRLPAEMLRDAALISGGLLVERLGGPPVKPYQPPGLWKGQNAFLPEYVQDKGESLYRRSLYTFWRRTSPPPSMLAFDAPSRETCTVRRQTTSTPLQPLVTLNDPQFVEAARCLGERLLAYPGPLLEDKIAHAFRFAATRQPTAKELEILSKLHAYQLARFKGDPNAAKKLLVIGDRKANPAWDPPNLAAATVVASAILNLDATATAR